MRLPVEQLAEPAAPPFESAPRVLVQEESRAYSLEQILAMLRRRLGVIAVVAILGTALAITASFLISPKYAATAAVSVDASEPRFTDVIGEHSGAAPRSGVDTKIALIVSRPLLMQVMDDLNLYNDPLFEPRPLYDEILQRLSTLSFFPESWFTWAGPVTNPVPAVEPSRTAPSEIAREVAFEIFLRHLQVTSATTEAGVIYIKVTLIDAVKAAAIANALADAYVRWEIKHRQEMARQAALWLAPRLKELQAAVQQAEQSAADFRVAHGISANNAEGGTLNDQRIANLKEELVSIRAEQIQKQAQLERIRASRNTPNIVAEVPDSSLILQLRVREVDLQRQRAQLARNLGQNHPQMLDLKAQIQDIERSIQLEVDQTIASMQAEISILASREKVIEKEFQTLKAGSVQDREAEVGLQELERQAGTERDLYETYLSRYRDARQEMEVVGAKAQVISPAAPPARSTTPGPIIVGFVGFAASLMLGSMVAILRERLDRHVQNARQLEHALGIPALGYLPLIRRRRLRKYPASYIAKHPSTFFAEAVQSIMIRLHRSFGTIRSSVIMITSALPEEGKTTLAVCLAAAAVRAGLRTVIVELDLRHPSIARRIGAVRPRTSLADYLAGKATHADVVQHDSKTGIDFITVEEMRQNPLRFLQDPLLDNLIQTLRAEYDQVILDSPPLLAVSEALVAARLADCFVLVARWKSTETAAVSEALRQLSEPEVRPVGFVLTMVDIKKYKLFSQGEAGTYFRYYQKYYVK